MFFSLAGVMIWWIRISKRGDNTRIVCFCVFLCRVFVSVFKSSFLRWIQIFILRMSELQSHQMLLNYESLCWSSRLQRPKRSDLAELGENNCISTPFVVEYLVEMRNFTQANCKFRRFRILNTARLWWLDTSWRETDLSRLKALKFLKLGY